MMTFNADQIPVTLLPQPVGWRLLIAPITITPTSKGGIVFVQPYIKEHEYFRTIAKVLAVGPEAYKHSKFSGVPWISVGDIIQYNMYNGLEFDINYNNEVYKMRYINDDEVLSIIPKASTELFS